MSRHILQFSMADNVQPTTSNFKIEILPFADLPYEFKERFAKLLPRDVLATFARIGHEASLFAFPYIRFVKKLRISAKSHRPYLKIAINENPSVSYHIKTETRQYYVTKRLTLNFHSRTAFKRVFSRVHGPFSTVIYDCDLCLKHLIRTLNYPSLKKIYIDSRIPLQPLIRFLKFCQWLDSNSQRENPVKLIIKEEEQGSHNMVILAPIVLGNPHVRWA